MGQRERDEAFRRALELGRIAGEAGKPASVNPYKVGRFGMGYHAWQLGHSRATAKDNTKT